MSDRGETVERTIGQPQYEEVGEFPVERGYIWTTCSSVENANPLFWDDAVAAEITDGPIAPPTMLSVWFRPHNWSPGRSEPAVPLQVHFDLKAHYGLPEAVISDNTIVFHDPVRIGDVITSRQVLRSVSDPKTTKLGPGRFWVIDVEYVNQRGDLVGVESYTGFGYRRGEGAHGGEGMAQSASKPSSQTLEPGPERPGPQGRERAAVLDDVQPGDTLPELRHDVSASTIVLGALASRDWRPMHHDHDFAVNRNGTQDIFMNTPNQAAWFERYVTDWTGPKGRLGRMKFRMKGSVFPGDTMLLTAKVEAVTTDDAGCGWATLLVTLSVDGDAKTDCSVRVALPTTDDDNPWTRRGDAWRP